ncbi:MAG: hypothetical protein R3Y06_05250 [Faecalibacterium sp.]
MLKRTLHRTRMRQLRQRLKSSTTAFNLFLRCVGALALGVLMYFNDTFFLARTKQVIFLYFAFVVVSSFLQILSASSKGVRNRFFSFGRFLLTTVVLAFLWMNIQSMLLVVPVALALWLMILSLSSFISFVQYRDEKEVASFRYFIGGVGNIGFAMLFILRADDIVAASIHILGIYCVVHGISLFCDFLVEAIPNQYLNRLKQRVRLAPPFLLTVLMPQSLLNGLNEFFKERVEEPLQLRAENPPERLAGAAVNVEVFIHASKTLTGFAGHVDLAIGDTIYCYGAYDKQQSKKYGGVAGAGVMYEVHGKEDYLTFCKTLNHETVFGFGLVLSEQELGRMKEKIAQMKARAYPWLCPAQRAAKEGKAADGFTDVPSRLSRAIEVSFYKFEHGIYKYYWMLGTNCVTFADDLLKASGMKTVLTGIITPGTYYSFLNAEFLKGSSVIVKREVYTKASDLYVAE